MFISVLDFKRRDYITAPIFDYLSFFTDYV